MVGVRRARTRRRDGRWRTSAANCRDVRHGRCHAGARLVGCTVPYAWWYCSVVQVAWSMRSTSISQMWSRSRWIPSRNSVLLTGVRPSSGLHMDDCSGTGLATSTSSGRVRPARSTVGPRLHVHRETSTQPMTTCGRRVMSFQNCNLDFGLSRIHTGTSLPGPSWPTSHNCGEIAITTNMERNAGRLRISIPTQCCQFRWYDAH
jgi:hypothetical protein